MSLEIYEMVKKIIGVLPIELHFIYGICTIILFMIAVLIVLVPLKIVYNISK